MRHKMKRLNVVLILALIGVCQNLSAEVTSSGAGGFNLKLVTTVDVDPAIAYQQFLRVDEWWVASHSYFLDAENFSIEAKAGGCFCEISGANEVEHMRVTFVQPGRELRMTGGLGPLQMLGATGGMSWLFEAIEGGGTRITHSYNVSGFMAGGLDQIAAVVDAVQNDQLQSLANKIRNR